jgi:hypothetical protein
MISLLILIATAQPNSPGLYEAHISSLPLSESGASSLQMATNNHLRAQGPKLKSCFSKGESISATLVVDHDGQLKVTHRAGLSEMKTVACVEKWARRINVKKLKIHDSIVLVAGFGSVITKRPLNRVNGSLVQLRPQEGVESSAVSEWKLHESVEFSFCRPSDGYATLAIRNGVPSLSGTLAQDGCLKNLVDQMHFEPLTNALLHFEIPEPKEHAPIQLVPGTEGKPQFTFVLSGMENALSKTVQRAAGSIEDCLDGKQVSIKALIFNDHEGPRVHIVRGPDDSKGCIARAILRMDYSSAQVHDSTILAAGTGPAFLVPPPASRAELAKPDSTPAVDSPGGFAGMMSVQDLTIEDDYERMRLAIARGHVMEPFEAEFVAHTFLFQTCKGPQRFHFSFETNDAGIPSHFQGASDTCVLEEMKRLRFKGAAQSKKMFFEMNAASGE